MKEDQMIQIANLFDKTLKVVQKFKTGITQPEDKSQMEIFANESLKKELNQIKQEVLSLCKKFPIY
jgi:glycine/serine hydroxymethyltransferase